MGGRAFVDSGTLEASPGGLGEDVVETRRVEFEVGNPHPGLAQCPDHLGLVGRPALQADRHPTLAGRTRGTESPKDGPSGCGISVADVDTQGWSANRGLQFRGRARANDPTSVDDGDPVGQLVGFLQILGGQEHGGAVLRVEPPTLLPEGLAAGRVESGSGLVEEEDARLMDE